MIPLVSSNGGGCHDNLTDVESKELISGLVGELVGANEGYAIITHYMDRAKLATMAELSCIPDSCVWT